MKDIQIATNETILEVMRMYREQLKVHRRINYLFFILLISQSVLFFVL